MLLAFWNWLIGLFGIPPRHSTNLPTEVDPLFAGTLKDEPDARDHIFQVEEK